MRWLGLCFCLCLLILYVLCGQYCLSSHVLRTPRGLITLPSLFIWREEEKGRRRIKESSVIDCFPSHNRPQVQVCSWALHLKTVFECMSVAARFWRYSLDQSQIAALCHIIRSEGYCFAILGRPSFRITLKKGDVIAQTRTLAVIKNEPPVIT